MTDLMAELKAQLEETAQAQAWETESWTGVRGEPFARFRKGSYLVTATTQAEGAALRMVAFLDYGGQDDLNYLDGKTFKTSNGAARFVQRMLK